MMTMPTLETISSRLRLKQLRLLVALDDHGSIHRAAEIIGITQPGATKALHDVEETLGATLFERTSKGLNANAMGRCAIRYARLILTDLSHLRQEMQGIFQGHGGRITVGTIMGGVPLLTDSLLRLRKRQPQATIEIVEDTSVKLLSLLDQGRLDVALCYPSVSPRPTAYDSISMKPEALVVMANPKHPLAGRSSLALEDLADSGWVVFSANMPLRQTLEREFHEAGVNFPAHPIETSSTFATLLLLINDPNLVAVLPTDVAELPLLQAMLTLLPCTITPKTEPFAIVTRTQVELSQLTHLLIEELTK